MIAKEFLKNTIFFHFFQLIKLFKFKRAWRKKNNHNYTDAQCIFNPSLVEIGNYTYGDLNIISFNNISKLTIKSFCSIGPNVTFLLDAEHSMNAVSSYPFKVAILKTQRYEAISKGSISVDSDVWIGYGATILSGVHIGQGAIIAANAVVTKDIPPYAVAAGNPARVIKYRFNPQIIETLLNIDYDALDINFITNNINKLYTEIDDSYDFDWLPKHSSTPYKTN